MEGNSKETWQMHPPSESAAPLTHFQLTERIVICMRIREVLVDTMVLYVHIRCLRFSVSHFAQLDVFVYIARTGEPSLLVDHLTISLSFSTFLISSFLNQSTSLAYDMPAAILDLCTI